MTYNYIISVFVELVRTTYSEYEAWKKAQGGDTQPHRVRYKKLIAD